MSSSNSEDPDTEEKWCSDCRVEAAAYMKNAGVTHGRIGEWPAWHVAPCVSVWAIESSRQPDWIGWWVVCGDLPTDYVSAETIKHPREAMRSISERWTEVSDYMQRGEKHPSINLGQPEAWSQLASLLRSRAQVLARWVSDDSVWDEHAA